ncbi:unnamed protein product, partial [Hydatigera taeniaeformis]|uniref:Protein CASC5 n=1 Tax=Hydatigena taeniaeformis TaxID=6205 RepID=A0A0R3WRU4_HYDTA
AIKSAQSSIDGKKVWIKRDTFSNTSSNYLRSSKAEDSDSEAQGSSEFVATLRVKDMQSSAERRLVSGFTQGKMNLKEVNLMHNHVETNENGVQVGLSLIPKVVKVESIRMENLDVVNERGEAGNTEQISVSAMLCSRPTQYDEILTESRGVTVLPITSAEDIHIAHKKETHYATIESQKDVGQQGYYACTNADIGNSYLARPQARIRVHHTEFSADTNDQTTVSTCDINRSKLKIDGTTQVGATFIPTELKMQEMRLGFQRIQSLSRSMRTETVLCPTDIGINSILNECSGIEIAPIRGISELSIHLAQGQFSAEVLHDSGSNQMCIELKEESLSTSRQFPPKFTPLVEPTVYVGHAQSTASLNQMTYSSDGCTMSSKLVQVGTLLIPTAVTMEKVKVNHLEVEVPLSPARSAEVNVSAVLASSATELTSVLTNDSGIHVVPVSKVNEVEIDANGGNYKGTISASAFKRSTGTFQTSASIADSSSACAPGVQKIVIPISASNMVGSASSSVEYLLRQSKDLSRIHEALQSVQTRLSLRESDTMSVPSYRRPGLLRISEQSFTPVNGSVKMPSNPSDVEFKDTSAQLGPRLVPHAVEVRDSKLGDGERVLTNARTPTHQEVEIRGIICSSAIPYEQTLGESIGVNAEPIKAAKNMNIKPDQTRPSIHSDATTQVGAIVMHQQQSMQKIGRETGNFGVNRTLSRGKIESNIYTTRLESFTELCEGPGITIANFDGCISTRNNTIENSDDSIPRVNNHTSPYPTNLKLEGLRAPYFENSESNIPEVHETSICQISKRLVSSASQVGTLLVPAKVCMDKIAVDQLVVDVPLTEWRTSDLSVSAILASTATEMVPLITDTPGIQIIEMKDLDELGIQVGDEVYVASVVAPPVKYVNAAYGPTRDFGVGTKSANRKQEFVFIPVPKATEAAHLTHRAENLLNQSTELRKVHSLLQSSSFQPRIRIASTSGTSMHLVENVDAQQSTTSKPSERSVYTCPCGRQYGLTNSISRPITELYNSSGTCGIMEGTSGSKMQESYHVACEATIKPDMFSKRLTANILTSSNDSRSRFTAAVPSKSFPCDGVQVMSGR